MMPKNTCPHTDLVLKALCDLPDPLGSLVRAFPGRAAAAIDGHWIDDWFIEQARAFAAGKPPKPIKLTAHEPGAGELSVLAKPPVRTRVRIISILPRHFRGFRTLKEHVNLEADLVIVEGPNSSGKTSLAEALEWVFTGGLSRRASGHPRELANCIANEFRPDEEPTWVECLLTVDGKPVAIKRVLLQDYSEKATGGPQSEFYRDGQLLSPKEEEELLVSLFAGVAPILMQHTLRQFVHDTPDGRRQYFERLLQIDELTALIEKGVVGDVRLAEFLPPAGAVSYSRWEDLRAALKPAARSILEKLERSATSLSTAELQVALAAVASSEFSESAPQGASFADALSRIQATQAAARDKRFPLLTSLRPAEELQALSPTAQILAKTSATHRVAQDHFATARRTVDTISQAELAVARAVEELVKAGLIDTATTTSVTCPLCEYPDAPTLTAQRVVSVRAQLPLVAAFDQARTVYVASRTELAQEIQALHASLGAATPKIPSKRDIEAQLKAVDPEVRKQADRVCSVAQETAEHLQRTAALLTNAERALAKEEVDKNDPLIALTDALTSVGAAEPLITDFANHFGDLERAIGLLALEDPRYASRERWLNVAADPDAVAQGIRWESAKVKAQELLADLRTGLIDLRTEIIEDARRTFSDRMTDVWNALRRDTASRFSRLTIPTARGRGYKLEMEVKATLSDGKTDPEVDALKVFSESQINVLGLAAYITRARLLGHATLIFDDPVQSMDEEHYRSFAGPLLTSMLKEGFQVVVLTHSDQFARDIADHHYAHGSFATLRTRGSRRHGCQVDEGSRRVAERLKLAESLADEGKLSDAWKMMRLALERLYLITCAAHQPGFDPRSWRQQTAEFMRESGAGTLVEQLAPGTGPRLREILTLTAAGAHDKAAPGITDLKNSVDFVRSLLAPLRVGGG